MAPEYGATCGFFPVDDETLRYLRQTGRDEARIALVEAYAKENGMWRGANYAPVYTDTLELDMGDVVPAISGPKRPQDHTPLTQSAESFYKVVSEYRGVDMSSEAKDMAAEGPVPSPVKSALKSAPVAGEDYALTDGSVVIASITSCTNTSNPYVMIGAGLVARKARALGLTRKPWVKTSLAPGSQVVSEYLEAAGLQEDLDAIGFNLVGYGCTTCIGNSGPLPEPISKAINEHDLLACSVLSGNRNFEGRIGPDLKCNYLASPPLVVAYAIAGTVDIDLQNEPLAKDNNGNDVYLKDIWPTQQEVNDLVATCVTRQQFVEQYADVFKGPGDWQSIESATGNLYDWNEKSTYVQEPPFFEGLSADAKSIESIKGARCLAKLGDSVTTDHISPAGAIKTGTPAADYLDANGVPKSLYNSYGSRRGNDRVMTRGTFANIRVKNQLAVDDAGKQYEGGYTKDFTTGKVDFIYNAVQNYKKAGTPLVVLAGVDYGMGSSRDWAAKGTFLLNVKAVLASSFERIHRSNLVGMGVLPLTFAHGQTHESLGLTGEETFDIPVADDVKPRQIITVTATKADGTKVSFDTLCRIDTPVEVDYYRNGGILHTVLRNMAKA